MTPTEASLKEYIQTIEASLQVAKEYQKFLTGN